MNQFKFLSKTIFESHLKIYELVGIEIQNDISHLESKKSIKALTAKEMNLLKLYLHNSNILIASTFLQIYGSLEEVLYHECTHQLIKKKASLSRFEGPLEKQGYSLNNEQWRALLNISKIRNCLLHGNGRLDSDQYGIDTKETINEINSDANAQLIEIAELCRPVKDTLKIKLNAPFLQYCVEKIKQFIDVQK